MKSKMGIIWKMSRWLIVEKNLNVYGKYLEYYKKNKKLFITTKV